MTPHDVIRTILHLVREKDRNPQVNLVPTISTTTNDWSELCTILDTTITFLRDELARTRNVQEFVQQFDDLLVFGQITEGLTADPGEPPC